MVWFQCEDCGENLKKPKLPNHFRICSAYKLSCIDCGKTFDQASVQNHNQCISEAEKYGPKGQAKPSSNSQNKPEKPKPNADVDINVGLSSRPPWFCSLCNTQATSQQTLLGHADGKKHRAKARAFHASQKQSAQAVEPIPNKDNVSGGNPTVESAEINGLKEVECASKGDTPKEAITELPTKEENASQKKSKRKKNASDGNLDISEQNNRCDLANGEVVQAEQPEDTQGQRKKKKHGNENSNCKEDSFHKIKWKKLVTSTLKENSDGMMKIKKLQKVVIRALRESGVTGDESELCETLMGKINSSSRFVINNKKIQLASGTDEA